MVRYVADGWGERHECRNILEMLEGICMHRNCKYNIVARREVVFILLFA